MGYHAGSLILPMLSVSSETTLFSRFTRHDIAPTILAATVCLVMSVANRHFLFDDADCSHACFSEIARPGTTGIDPIDRQ